ncbi:MAG TPA: hypothetical protein VMW13_09060 [Dehalococcoidales bacterium]|nr:hypothetical protein [Dehalococcoidales bacterium]
MSTVQRLTRGCGEIVADNHAEELGGYFSSFLDILHSFDSPCLTFRLSIDGMALD